MNNQVHLVAILHKIDALRYTPSGVPVLDMILVHSSWQVECGVDKRVHFSLQAKLLGEEAQIWQNKQGEKVCLSGFLAQKNLKDARPILHIQNIQKYKG